MKLLLDTHLLIWAAEGPHSLSSGAIALIADPANEPCFSAVSIWEIGIKQSLGRPDFTLDPAVFRRLLLDNGYTEIPISAEHAATAATLPRLHADPFDRLLVAQATHDGITLLTADQQIAQYPGPIRLV